MTEDRNYFKGEVEKVSAALHATEVLECREATDATALRAANLRLREQHAKLLSLADLWADCAEFGWTVIANVSGGDWTKQTKDWLGAAERFRDKSYYKCLDVKRAYLTAAATSKPASRTDGEGEG
jgi:hypothetical protein